MLSIVFGLSSALIWGAADFTGGLASRRTGAYRAVFFGETIGLLLLVSTALSLREPVPDQRTWMIGAFAGALGTLGLLLLYHALATGSMSIAAPVSALMAGLLPVVAGTFAEGLPGPLILLGFGLALGAIWLISQSGQTEKKIYLHINDLRIPLLSGIGFGSYMVLTHTAAQDSTLWPMVASRLAGLLVTGTIMLLRGDSWHLPSGTWRMVALNGVLDVGGNGFFILAGQVGRLDIAAVLSSLYPGSTVLLASLVLKERISRTQWLGILAALLAIIMFTL